MLIMIKWVSVAEYAAVKKRSPQSVYRSVQRGTVEHKLEDGVILVPLEVDDAEQESIPVHDPDAVPDDNQEERMYTQSEVNWLLEQIEELKADKAFFKNALALALMPPQSDDTADDTPDDIPKYTDSTPEHIPDDTPNTTKVDSPTQPPTKASFGARLRYLVRGY